MKKMILLIALVFIILSCKKDKEYTYFRFINLSDNNIDTIKINYSQYTTPVRVIFETNINPKDTTDYKEFPKRYEPVELIFLIDTNKIFNSLTYGAYDPYQLYEFESGKFSVIIDSLDIDSLNLFIDIKKD